MPSPAAKTDLPRALGTYRPAARIQPGWWVYVEDDDNPWKQVDWVAEAAGIVVVNFTDGTQCAGPKIDEVMTLTTHEGRKHGLSPKEGP